MELNLLLAGQTVLFGEEGRAEGRFVVVVEFLVGEASEDGGFADSWVTHRDQFQLGDLALSLI